MLASRKGGALYIGVTSDLPNRLYDHQLGQGSKHTARYKIKTLFWFEHHEAMESALQREKSLKRYPRKWKVNLIQAHNPHWLPLDPDTGELIVGPRQHGDRDPRDKP